MFKDWIYFGNRFFECALEKTGVYSTVKSSWKYYKHLRYLLSFWLNLRGMSFLLLNSCNFRYNLVSVVIFVSEEKSRTRNFVYGLQQQTFLNADAEKCFLNCRFHSTNGVI